MIEKEQEKNRAIQLRKSGFSYNEIRNEIKVAKSTLSLWLRSVGLAKRHQRRLSERQREAREKGIRLIHERRLEKTYHIKQEASGEIKSLSLRERWLIGVALYWAEGSKEKERSTRVQFSNSDPHMILLFRKWCIDFLKMRSSDFDYTLSIHERSPSIYKAIGFWSDFLNIEPHELRLSFKKHNPSPKRKNIGVHYNGLIRFTVKKSVDLNRKISGWIDGIILAQRQ